MAGQGQNRVAGLGSMYARPNCVILRPRPGSHIFESRKNILRSPYSLRLFEMVRDCLARLKNHPDLVRAACCEMMHEANTERAWTKQRSWQCGYLLRC
jgi:hypothetical protein